MITPLDHEQRLRLRKVIRKTGILLAAGLVYALFYLRTGIGIPCPINLVTGLKCPGCGVTHMLVSLLRLDFKAAWHYNPALLSMMPAGVFLTAYSLWFYVKTSRFPSSRWYNAVIILLIVILLIFGVTRNCFN